MKKSPTKITDLCIELYICTQLTQQLLFNYQTQNNPNLQYHGYYSMVYHLDMPLDQSDVYYFFHESVKKRGKIVLERRENMHSKFSYKKGKIEEYRLTGGVRLFYRAGKLLMEPIGTQKITRNSIDGVFEKVLDEQPYLIVKSFKEQGYPLQVGQILKIGFVLFKIKQIAFSDLKMQELENKNKTYVEFSHLNGINPFCMTKPSQIKSICVIPDKHKSVILGNSRKNTVPENYISFDDDSLCTKHAEIYVKIDEQTQNKQLYIRDLHSKYGTLISEDGMEVKLSNKDKGFQIGNFIFVLRIRRKQDLEAEEWSVSVNSTFKSKIHHQF